MKDWVCMCASDLSELDGHRGSREWCQLEGEKEFV